MENLLFTDAQAGAFIAGHMGLFFGAVIGSVLLIVAFGEKEDGKYQPLHRLKKFFW